MTTEYSNWLVDKITDKEIEMVAMRKQFLRVGKDMMMTTMNLKEGSRMTKYLAQRKSMINLKRKTEDKVTFLFFSLNMFI